MNNQSQQSPLNAADTDPLVLLASMMGTGGTSAAIIEQERQGQQQIVESTVLPTDLNGCCVADFEALGFTFGAVNKSDPVFRQATLPQGWGRKGSDHAMWSYIVDRRGVRRVAVFYKAAFYDRRAHMSIVNVGADLANDFIYGDTTTFVLRSDLTDEECVSARTTATRYVEDAVKQPGIYGDLLSRARQVIDATAVAAPRTTEGTRDDD